MTDNSVQRPQTTGGEEVAVLLVTRLSLVAAGLVIQSLLAYALLPAGRGSYAVCAMFGSLFGILFAPGADRGTQYLVMARKLSVSQGVSIALAISTVGSSIAIALSLPLIHARIGFFQQAEARTFYIALALIPLIAFSSAIQLQLAGLRRFGRLALYQLIQAVANVAAIALFVWGLDLGVAGAVLALATSHVAMITASLWDLRRYCGLHLERPERDATRAVLAYGRRYFVARVGNLVDLQIGVLFLSFVARQAEIGIFAVASVLMLRVFMISNAIESSLLPRVASEEGGRPELVALCARISGWITGAVLLGVVAISTPLVRILLSEEFLAIVPLIWIMAPGVFVYSGAKVLMTYFRGVDRPELCSWAVWLGLSTNLLVILLLYPRLGVAALAWALTAGLVCRSLFLGLAYRRVAHMSLSATWFPRREDAIFLAGSGRTLLERVVGSQSTDA